MSGQSGSSCSITAFAVRGKAGPNITWHGCQAWGSQMLNCLSATILKSRLQMLLLNMFTNILEYFLTTKNMNKYI